jgi:hypothetical protein
MGSIISAEKDIGTHFCEISRIGGSGIVNIIYKYGSLRSSVTFPKFSAIGSKTEKAINVHKFFGEEPPSPGLISLSIKVPTFVPSLFHNAPSSSFPENKRRGAGTQRDSLRLSVSALFFIFLILLNFRGNLCGGREMITSQMGKNRHVQIYFTS